MTIKSIMFTFFKNNWHMAGKYNLLFFCFRFDFFFNGYVNDTFIDVSPDKTLDKSVSQYLG